MFFSETANSLELLKCGHQKCRINNVAKNLRTRYEKNVPEKDTLQNLVKIIRNIFYTKLA